MNKVKLTLSILLSILISGCGGDEIEYTEPPARLISTSILNENDPIKTITIIAHFDRPPKNPKTSHGILTTESNMVIIKLPQNVFGTTITWANGEEKIIILDPLSLLKV